MCPSVQNSDTIFNGRLLVDTSLIFGRCRCPSRLAAPVSACDGEAVQYVTGEFVDHITGQHEPKPAGDSVRCSSDTSTQAD